MAVDSGSTTAWLLAATALVMLMTPGVGFFYGGLVRKKNFISMVMLSFIAFALVSIQWITVGYSLSFGPDIAGLIGGTEFLGLANVGLEPGPAGYAPMLFMMYQLTFAAVTLAIVTSGMAERIKLSSFIVFSLLWTTLVYDPLCHWVWGGGWLSQFGVIDFAGGLVVHISAGFAALALAIAIGNRSGFGTYSMEPHNRPMTLLGVGLLWFGWFGFNGGSALAANGIAVNAIVVTNTAAAAGALAWLGASWYTGRPSSLGIMTGAVAGLGAITPAAGFVNIWGAIIIGVVASLICYKAMLWRVTRHWDESLDAWACHGMGGLWGMIAAGIFAVSVINGYSGLIEGNITLFVHQVVGALVGVGYSFVVTFLLAKVVDKVMGLRVSEQEEYVGLDLSQHGERA